MAFAAIHIGVCAACSAILIIAAIRLIREDADQ